MSTPSDPTPPSEPAASPYGPPPQPPGPYGQPPYGPPGYPPPPYWQPPYGGPAYAMPGVRTNGLAIAAFVCALAGVAVYVTAPIGVVLGIVALSQIKRSREGGRGLAVAGIVIGVVVTIAGLLLAALAVWFVVDVAHKCDTRQYTGEDYRYWCQDNPFTTYDDSGDANLNG